VGGAQEQDRRYGKMDSIRFGIEQPDWCGAPDGTLLPSEFLTFFLQPMFLKFDLKFAKVFKITVLLAASVR
jgi:hypothetical protein